MHSIQKSELEETHIFRVLVEYSLFVFEKVERTKIFNTSMYPVFFNGKLFLFY